MEVVLDANVLFRTLISQGEIIRLAFNKELKLFAPERLREEFSNHEQELLEKSKLSSEDFEELSSLIFARITFAQLEEYKALLPNAAQLLGSHAKDEEFIALCLLKNIKVWTYEKLLFKIGFGISTKQIAEELFKTVEPAGAENLP